MLEEYHMGEFIVANPIAQFIAQWNMMKYTLRYRVAQCIVLWCSALVFWTGKAQNFNITDSKSNKYRITIIQWLWDIYS